jgi:anti-sigma factor RsiW
MKCHDVRALINAGSARELQDVYSALREHIESCDSCSRLYKLRLIASQALAASTGGVRAGEKFTMRVLDALDREAGWPEESRARRQMSWAAMLRPSPAWAALALVLVLISGYNYLRTLGYFHPGGEVPINMGRFVDDVGHDAFLYSRNDQTLEVLTDSPPTVREWFNTRLDFPVIVPERLPGGYVLEGARLWHTVSRLSAFARYQTPAGDWVALFLISSNNLADQGGRTVRAERRTYRTGESFQYNAVAWKESEAAYALVGRLDTDELVRLAEVFEAPPPR